MKKQNKNNLLLSIILVNYNTKEFILNCIQSIQDKIDANRCPYEVIVSDNGSTDGSVPAIRERFPWVKVIENKANLGFGKANNIGAKQSQGNVLFFLNPDTLIGHGIEEMYNYILEHKNVGLLGPVVYNERNEVVLYHKYWESAFLRTIFKLPLFYSFQYSYFKKKFVDQKKILIVGSVYGCAMMLRQTVFNEVGGYDENMFMYYEEMDISWRLRKTGYSTRAYPNAYIIHLGGGSANRMPSLHKTIIMAQSLKIVLKKQFPHIWYLRYFLVMLGYLRLILGDYIKLFFPRVLLRNGRDNRTIIRDIKSNFLQLKTFYKVLTDKI